MREENSKQGRVRIQQVQTLSHDWYLLQKTTFDYLRRDGQWQTQTRETYDRGDGATILLYNKVKRTVILIRQFRFPTYREGHDGFLIESAAGLLEEASAEQRIRAEVEEETGYRVGQVQKIFQAFMSPGSVTERLHFFAAEYDPALMAANVAAMQAVCLPLYAKGHMPVLGEWLALPMLALAGSTRVGDAVYEELFHAHATRLLSHCDAVLRLGGASQGADQMVSVAQDLGLSVYFSLDEIAQA